MYVCMYVCMYVDKELGSYRCFFWFDPRHIDGPFPSSSLRLFIGNLSLDVTSDDLIEVHRQLGEAYNH